MENGEEGTATRPEHRPVLGRRSLDAPRRRFVEEALGPLPSIQLADGWLATGACRLVGAVALVVGRTVLLTRDGAARIAAWDEAGRLRLLHEAVHVRQYHQQGTMVFLVRYLAAYLGGRLAGLGHEAAYRAIPFEREASEIEKTQHLNGP